jgi:succinyl-CoA synthetase beta subunit
MNLHEYQAKNLLKQYGLPTPIGGVAGDAAAAVAAAKSIISNQHVVKAQIHAGGRGKAGGVKLLNSWLKSKLTQKIS